MISRADVVFDSLGADCSGWLYRPADAPHEHPLAGVVMAHGFTGVKEMDLDAFARGIAEAGIVVLLFDYRGFGTSGGEPRQHVDPRAQLEDYTSALSWLSTQEGVDVRRLGVWGTSFSGGHVLHLGAYDGRVKAVVSQVPFVDGVQTAVRVLGAERLRQVSAALEAERANVYAGATPSMIPVVAAQGEMAAIPQAGTREHLLSVAEQAPSWRNEITLQSLERLIEYAPGDVIERVSPTPLLMLVAGDDLLTSSDLALAAYNRARQPKALELIPVDEHHGVYGEPARSRAIAAAVRWFQRHLDVTTAAAGEETCVPASTT